MFMFERCSGGLTVYFFSLLSYMMCTFFEIQTAFILSFDLSDDLLEDSDSEEHSRSDSVTGM